MESENSSPTKSSSNGNSLQQDYKNLVNFMKRVSLTHQDQDESETHSNFRQKLIPQVRPSKEGCKIELPTGEKVEIPILEGTVGPKSIDGRGFFEKTGLYTYDPGFTSTASCVSAITYIDGDLGQLWYRGYSIDQLAANCTFIETCFLLLYGELPSQRQLDEFENRVKDEMLVHEKIKDFYKGFSPNAHPMSIMCGIVGGLSSFYHEAVDVTDPKQREQYAIKLIAKMPTLAAIAFRTSKGLPIIPQVMVDALDKILILHADHEQNASTSTVRITGSSLANPFACISSGIASLWGPAHGGANEACLQMLDEIGSTENIPKYIAMAKDKNSSFRIMGFGHRVYKNFDPRAKEMQKMCHRVLQELNISNEGLFELAIELEKAALSDQYFISRKLYPNVDFYSGIVLQALKIPRDMFTVIFALARSIGWITQWNEMMSESIVKIGRPRQLYVGNKKRKYMDIKNRVSFDLF
ncbi:citrate synthase [Stylonychia lemnae]|uniref:Citrate synthase n=1 Tax=Stylonychia lemnae TaxID=5949 RepID=A0A078ATN7_STYLE|nr:citrate synthase [Stylonychia lemnae]|eukprot:CDW85790.1 citrate synthase [Stylonychia lemnae]